jgi:hypothetical protein
MSAVRTITIKGREIPYTLRRRKWHPKITLSVRSNGAITVTAPVSMSVYLVERFLEHKKGWLSDTLASLPASFVRSPNDVRDEYTAHKEAARALVHRELARLNAHYGFVYGRVSIRNTTSRWGSCSSKKNLNFSYKVVFLPPLLVEYLIVHELCHLKEMNHSPAFWSLVAEMVPDYRARRKALQAHGLS